MCWKHNGKIDGRMQQLNIFVSFRSAWFEAYCGELCLVFIPNLGPGAIFFGSVLTMVATSFGKVVWIWN